MTPRTATLIGLTAILMWSLLSVLTVATGKIPAFQLAAMTFAIGAAVGVRELDLAARGNQRVAAATHCVGRRRRRVVRLSRAVFPGAALRAAGRSRPAELSLAALDRAVLVVAAGRTAGAASHRRRAAGAGRHGAAVHRQQRRRLSRPARSRAGRGVRRRLRLGGLFGDVAQAQGGADRCGRRLLPRRPRCWLRWSMAWSRPRSGRRPRRSGSPSSRSASARWAPRSSPGTSA